MPPMIRPSTSSDSSHRTRAPRVASGGRVGGLLATVDSEEAFPSSSDLSRSVRPRLGPAKISPPGHKRIQLMELARDRSFSQLFPLNGIHSLPSSSKGPSLRFCNPTSHLLPSLIIPLFLRQDSIPLRTILPFIPSPLSFELKPFPTNPTTKTQKPGCDSVHSGFKRTLAAAVPASLSGPRSSS